MVGDAHQGGIIDKARFLKGTPITPEALLAIAEPKDLPQKTDPAVASFNEMRRRLIGALLIILKDTITGKTGNPTSDEDSRKLFRP
jgi:hypothetical protein